MSINNLIISYPDFQTNTVIDSEQFDTNNLEIVTKINEVIAMLNAIKASDIPMTEVLGVYGSDIQTVIESLNSIVLQNDDSLNTGINSVRSEIYENSNQLQSQIYNDMYTKTQLDPYLRGGDTLIRYEVFTITNANNGNGTFTYKNSQNVSTTGVIDVGGGQVFDLQLGSYEPNQNRIECIINDTIHKSPISGGLSELTSTSVVLIDPQATGAEVVFKYFERVGITGTGLIVVDTIAPPNGFMWYKVLP